MYIKYSLFILLAVLMTACSKDDAVPDKVQPTDTGIWVDERDGTVYHWVQYGNLQWTVENLKYDIKDRDKSTIYQPSDDYYTETNTQNLEKYGRLYTLEGAEVACPDGWRIPTDADWQQLEMILGMPSGDAEARDWRGTIAHSMFSTKDDACSLNLLLGGFYNTYTGMGASKWRFMGAFGFYWSQSEDTEKEGEYYFYRKFAYNRNEVYRESMESSANMLSVRLVRGEQWLKRK